MAKALFINAILSGKLGGTVYAHNKAGPYVRQYSVPTNPNSIAQAAARDSFSAAVTSWHILSDAEKAIWNTYATGDFKPKNPVTGMLYSGFNAFSSLWSASKNGLRKSRIYTLSSTLNAGLTYTEGDFLGVNSPPTGVFSANIEDGDSNALAVTLDSAILETGGKASFRLGFHSQADVMDFVEPITQQPVGYVMFAGNVIPQAASYTTKPWQTIIGTCVPPSAITGWLVADDNLEFDLGVADASIPDHKLWYDTGDICRVEIWALGQEGTLIRIGEKIVTVAAAS